MSGLRDLLTHREGRVIRLDPNTNLLAPRTVLPTLTAQHAPGDHWLACAVFADPGTDAWAQTWDHPPDLPDFLRTRLHQSSDT